MKERRKNLPFPKQKRELMDSSSILRSLAVEQEVGSLVAHKTRHNIEEWRMLKKEGVYWGERKKDESYKRISGAV